MSEKIVTVSPVTTDVGTDPLGNRGLIPVGTRLVDLPVSKFSDTWMKAVTQADQKAIAAYRREKAHIAEMSKEPDLDDAFADIETIREAVKSIQGTLGSLTARVKKIEKDGKE